MVRDDRTLRRSYVEQGYSVAWSYFDRVWSVIQLKKVRVEKIKITCFDWRSGILNDVVW